MGIFPGNEPSNSTKRVNLLRNLAYFSLKKTIHNFFDRTFFVRRFASRAAVRISGNAAKLFRDVAVWAKALEKEERRQFVRQAVALFVMLGITVGSVVTAMAAAMYASVSVDGGEKKIVGIESEDMRKSTSKILDAAGVSVSADDRILRTDYTEKQNDRADVVLTVLKAEHVSVAVDGKVQKVTAHYGDNVSDALTLADVTLGDNDTVSAPLSAPVKDGMKVTIRRRYHVCITADGKTGSLLVWEGTVSDALRQAGIALGAQDFPIPGPDKAVTEGMKIGVSRVSYRDVASTQALAYTTQTKRDSSMMAGTQEVQTAGQNGCKNIVTRQKILNGKVVQSSVIKTTVTKQPVSKVVVIGTKAPDSNSAVVCSDGTLLDSNGSTVSYRKMICGRCTAYCTGQWTASGMHAQYGRVAVNPNIIPYGTRLYICSPDGRTVYGYAVAADTGGAAMNGDIVADLFYSSYGACADFGARPMNVYILN